MIHTIAEKCILVVEKHNPFIKSSKVICIISVLTDRVLHFNEDFYWSWFFLCTIPSPLKMPLNTESQDVSSD